MYSDISNLTSFASNSFARALAVSVLPVPVGPTNKKLPIGLFFSLSPDLLTSILSTRLSIAGSCPKTVVLILVSKFLYPSVLSTSITSSPILLILAITVTMSAITTSLSLRNLTAVPAASITSSALSGKNLFLI